MNLLYLSPAYPPEMQQFTRGLRQVGAQVWGVGDQPTGHLPELVRSNLQDYLHVPSILDEGDVHRRVHRWLAGRRPDRIESNWEPLTLLAARLRQDLDVPGMSVETVRGFRDKPLMRERVAAAGLPVPPSARIRSRAQALRAAEEIGYPLVIKPVAGAGSADTFRAGDAAELQAALDRLGHVPEASCEVFVEGEELTYETLCIGGVPRFESVSRYVPSALIARQNEWISPIIITVRDLSDPAVAPGIALGRAVLPALGMGTGFTHMEWFRTPGGRATFGEIACRSPGANMVDLMNYAGDVDLYREWARAVCWGEVHLPAATPYCAAIVFKRASGQGRIRGVTGLDTFLARYHRWIARVDLLPVGAPRRDWRQTFLSDGNLVIRHPDPRETLRMAEEAARTIQVWAG